jgi:hypothetical protein
MISTFQNVRGDSENSEDDIDDENLRALATLMYGYTQVNHMNSQHIREILGKQLLCSNERVLSPLSAFDVYQEAGEGQESGPRKLKSKLPVLTPVLLEAGSFLVHTEQGGFYRGGGNFTTNPYSFFALGKNKPPNVYWNLGEDDVVYRYTTIRDLVLIVLPNMESLHNWLEMILSPAEFQSLPYNKEDPSFPYESEQTFAWDYFDMGFICAVFGADGIIRPDEAIVCAPFEDKLKFISAEPVHRRTNIQATDQTYPQDIYYKPDKDFVKRMKKIEQIQQYRVLVNRLKKVIRH